MYKSVKTSGHIFQVAMEPFMKKQNIDGNATYKEYKLLQEVYTRWNSTFYVIERILKVNDSIERAILKLRKAPQPLSVDAFNYLNFIGVVSVFLY